MIKVLVPSNQDEETGNMEKFGEIMFNTKEKLPTVRRIAPCDEFNEYYTSQRILTNLDKELIKNEQAPRQIKAQDQKNVRCNEGLPKVSI